MPANLWRQPPFLIDKLPTIVKVTEDAVSGSLGFPEVPGERGRRMRSNLLMMLLTKCESGRGWLKRIATTRRSWMLSLASDLLVVGLETSFESFTGLTVSCSNGVAIRLQSNKTTKNAGDSVEPFKDRTQVHPAAVVFKK